MFRILKNFYVLALRSFIFRWRTAKISLMFISVNLFSLRLRSKFFFYAFILLYTLVFHQLIVEKGKKRIDEGVFIHFLEESFVGKKEEAGGGKKAPPLH